LKALQCYLKQTVVRKKIYTNYIMTQLIDKITPEKTTEILNQAHEAAQKTEDQFYVFLQLAKLHQQI